MEVFIAFAGTVATHKAQSRNRRSCRSDGSQSVWRSEIYSLDGRCGAWAGPISDLASGAIGDIS